MAPLKICHLLWGFDIGGIETMLVNIANAQAADGNKVHIVVVDDAVDPQLSASLSPEVAFHCVGRKPGSRSAVALIRLNLIIGRIHPDILHFHNLKLQRYVMPILYRKSCATCHSVALDELLPYIPDISNLFAISEGVRADIMRRTGVDSVVVLNGLPTSLYRRRDPDEPFGKPVRMVQIGRVNFSIKGQDITLKALKILRDRGVDCAVDFIGDGPDRALLTQMAEQAGLGRRVNVHGLKDQMYIRSHLADYDVLLQPSVHEGFGLTIAEGMAACVPVVVSDVEAQCEVVGNGRYGIIFKSEDPEDMARVIEELIDGGVDKSRIMSAMEYSAGCYDVRRTADEYLDHYHRILGDGRAIP